VLDNDSKGATNLILSSIADEHASKALWYHDRNVVKIY